jgi:hypothetical protein
LISFLCNRYYMFIEIDTPVIYNSSVSIFLIKEGCCLLTEQKHSIKIIFL